MYNYANLASTYSALLSLAILKDDYSRVNRKSIINSLKYLQQENGSLEADLRFVYCAFAISYLLNDWTGINIEKSLEFIKASQGPFQESHGIDINFNFKGGSTYCGVASLSLVNKINDVLENKTKTIQWCLKLQSFGFHGRINKPDDTCYSFWIGGAIKVSLYFTSKILDGIQFVNKENNIMFLKSTQTKYGGFSKYPGAPPGLTALCLMDVDFLKSIHPALNFSMDAYDFWSNSVLPKLI